MIFYTCIGFQAGRKDSEDLCVDRESKYITIVLQAILNTRLKDVLYRIFIH